MADITYCTNTNCPFKECERYLDKVKTSKAAICGRGYVSVSDFSGVCRDYIWYLVELADRKLKRNLMEKK